MKLSLLLCFYTLLLLSLVPPTAQAMTSDNYNLDQGDADIVPFEPHALPTQTPGQTITPSNLPLTKPTAFTLRVSQDIIPFGALTATNPVLRDLELVVESNENNYQVFAFENHALAANPVDMIPNTTCDNGSCTTERSAPWTNNLTYGFGYRFAEEPRNTYKQFIDASKTKQLLPIISEQAGTITKKLTYKVNVSRTQKQTSYLNVVTYIAIPNY